MIKGCQLIFWAFFLLEQSTCCCQNRYWKESLSKTTELSDDVIIFMCLLSSVTRLTSEASAIFFFSLSSCFDTERYCWWSWLRRLMSEGIGWYLYTIDINILRTCTMIRFCILTAITIPMVYVAGWSRVNVHSILHTSSLSCKHSSVCTASQAAKSCMLTGQK